MKKTISSFTLLASLAFATSAFADGSSSVNVRGWTSSSAVGATFTGAFGRTTVDGNHVGVNGSTHFGFDVGARGEGFGYAGASTQGAFSENRTMGTGTHGYPANVSFSNVNSAGGLSAWATAYDPHTQVFGDMFAVGRGTAKNGSVINFSQESGFSGVGTYNAGGWSGQVYGHEILNRP